MKTLRLFFALLVLFVANLRAQTVVRLNANSIIQADAFTASNANNTITGINANASGTFNWARVSKTGSSLADLATRSASDLTSGTVPTDRLYTTLAGYNVSNGSTLDAAGSIFAANGLDSGFYFFSWFSSTDHAPQLAAFITAAGTGATIRLERGKTYLLKKPLILLDNQTLDLNGATLKRADQYTTTTTSSIATGTSSQTVTVTDASGFSVGQSVAVGTSTSVYDVDLHPITAINGNTLTLGAAFTTAFSSGATIARGGPIVTTNTVGVYAAGVRVINGEIDGNRTNATQFNTWYHFQDVQLLSDNGRAERLYVHDSPSEGIYIGGANATVRGCRIDAIGGNGIHLSGWQNTLVEGNRISNTNLAVSTWALHNDGGITLSNFGISTNAGRVIIRDNWFDTCRDGVGGLDDNQSNYVLIDGNWFFGMTRGPIYIQASDDTFGYYNFTNNHCYNSGTITLNLTAGSPSGAVSYVTLAGNFLTDTRVNISDAVNVSITGNQFVQNNAVLSLQWNGSCTNVLVADNIFRHLATTGSNSVCVYYGSGTHTNVRYQGNVYDIVGGPSTAMAMRLSVGTPTIVGFTVSDIFRATSGASGVETYFGATIRNSVFADTGGTAITVCAGGSTSNRWQIIDGCTIRSSGQTVRIFGSTYNTVVSNCTLQTATVNSATDASVILANNLVEGGTSPLNTSPRAALGYGTGAGGAVTQSTDKTTGVTLDKVTGTITLSNATLNAGASVGFTLTNAVIAAGDAVIPTIKSGATADSYTVTVDATAAGSCHISLTNKSGGNLSEAVVISFVVLKSASS